MEMEGNDMDKNIHNNMPNMVQPLRCKNVEHYEPMRQKGYRIKNTKECRNQTYNLETVTTTKSEGMSRKMGETLLLLGHSKVNQADMLTSTMQTVFHHEIKMLPCNSSTINTQTQT